MKRNDTLSAIVTGLLSMVIVCSVACRPVETDPARYNDKRYRQDHMDQLDRIEEKLDQLIEDK